MAITIREAKTTEDVVRIAEISKEILEYLASKGKADFFGGVDEDEIKESMEGISTVLVAEKEETIVGFLLLLHEADAESSSFVINGYGVKPSMMRNGIGKLLMREAKKYALSHLTNLFKGTIHPDNQASIRTMMYIAKEFTEGEEFTHTMKDGRVLRRKPFLLML